MILAIIALIAVPIVLGIVSDSKKESINRSIELYIDHVQKMIAKEQMKDSTFNPKECKIGENKLICGDTEIEIAMKGEVPESGIIIVNNSKISYRSVLLNGKYYNNVATLLEDADNDGEISIGDKYSYNVNGEDEFNFYVLSIENDKVNLIMDRNICNDGTINYTENNNYCRYPWHRDEDNNNYGPDTAMTNLYNGTKNWTNVPNMLMNYEDENNKEDDTKGYTSIITNQNTKETTITGKNNATNTTVGSNILPLKSRLPKQGEISQEEVGCHIWTSDSDYGTCPTWLIENLKYINVSSYAGSGNIDKYSMNNNSSSIQNIQGYWLLSSCLGSNLSARSVGYGGNISYGQVSYNGVGVGNAGGIRPVITVLISDLE